MCYEREIGEYEIGKLWLSDEKILTTLLTILLANA